MEPLDLHILHGEGLSQLMHLVLPCPLVPLLSSLIVPGLRNTIRHHWRALLRRAPLQEHEQSKNTALRGVARASERPLKESLLQVFKSFYVCRRGVVHFELVEEPRKGTLHFSLVRLKEGVALEV